jgi:hypothetical protein
VFQVDAKACNARGTMPKVIHFGTLWSLKNDFLYEVCVLLVYCAHKQSSSDPTI